MWYFLAGAIGFFLAYALCPAITLQVRFELSRLFLLLALVSGLGFVLAWLIK
jgi:uncharacterized membrane protein YciS (DUF1049 family)